MDTLLTDLLARWARATPNATVMEGPAGRLTYGELDRRSNQLARFLTRLGAGPGTAIGLQLAKGPHALVGIFGILKTGGCYVPIDPTGPAPRARRIIGEAGLGVLLVDASVLPDLTAALKDRARDGVTPIVVQLDGQQASGPVDHTWAEVAACQDAPVTTGPRTDEDPAYVLYTSGSTGIPKGVTLSHRAAMAFVRHCLETFGLTADDRVSSHAPLHFDLSILDVFASVAAGATIIPITGAARVFPATLAELVDGEAISVWYSVPFALVQLAQRGGLDRFAFAALRCVLFAGEPMPVVHLRALLDRWPAARFYNLYGPTETNVVTWHEVVRRDGEELTALPIGREWPAAEAVVVDEVGRPLAAGASGELWVRSATTMTGYWGDPTATARAFGDVHVHPQLPPRRFYRTGDRVRRDDDGVLWFLGRTDDMVKVRGQRVELGEVEAVLTLHPGLAEATVLAVPTDDVGVQLVAVVTPTDLDAPPGLPDVLAHCAARLPTYMVPARVELRVGLPRTSTGKLDRLAVAGDLAHHAAATEGHVDER